MLSSITDRRWARAGDRLAIREGTSDFTFRALLEWSEDISRFLAPIVREPGRRVALLLPNSATFVAAFFAASRVGAVVAPLSPQYRQQELAYYLTDLEAAAVICDAPRAALVSATSLPAGARPSILELSAGKAPHLVRAGDPSRPMRIAADSPPLLQQYTSGSTGAPKRVVRTHDALLAELDALRAVFEVTEADRFVGLAPFCHVNGLVRTMMTSMYAAATLYPVEEFRRRDVLDVLTRERITFFGGVPQMFALLGQTPARSDVDLSAMRIAFSSSAPLLPADAERFRSRYGVTVRQLYGSTETGTISVDRAPEASPLTVGTPLPGVNVEVVDEQGRHQGVGLEGELVIVSRFATSAYVGNPEATAESFRAGGYFSGDLGTKDRAGALALTGRKKLLINRGGFKVNPYEVEAAISEHPKVADVVVFPVPGPHGDDGIGCIVVPVAPCTIEEIITHCRQRIADYKIPSRVEFRGSLPKSPSGKVLRARLAEPEANG